jgi:NAD(P) transhydrogenase subunit alpha
MTIGVPKEARADERRVALVPDVVAELCAAGHRVVVESGAGDGAVIGDELFVAAGAAIGNPWAADVVVKVAPPMTHEVRLLAAGTLVGFLAPLSLPEVTAALADARVTAFGMDTIPPIPGAESIDALAGQDRILGYKAALLAAVHCTTPPARVLVVGGGMAGRQAAHTARRMGAHAVASAEAPADSIKTFDVVITTALVPGRPAPRLVTADAVRSMRPGSVIVDLAGESGGNCELTEPGGLVVRHGVTIVAPLNLAATMPGHASALYAESVKAFLGLMTDGEGVLDPDSDDTVIAGACVTRDGEVVHQQAREAMEALTA